MLSMRSSCERTLRRADRRRFWPLLFLYGALWLMVLPLSLWNRRWSVMNALSDPYSADPIADAVHRLEGVIYGGAIAAVVISAIFAVLLAMTLYGYLMSSRSVGLMHALPINRTRQFFHHFLVGVEIFTVVHVVTAAVALLVQAGMGVVSWRGTLEWLAVAELSSLFFFAFATLCAMVTGWVLAIPVIYVGVNAMFAAFWGLMTVLFELFYWGYSSSDLPAAVSWLTPFYHLMEAVSDNYVYDEILQRGSYRLTSVAWTALIVYALVGVVFALAAWQFYKRRPSEAAGDAVVFGWLRPIVLYVISVVGAMGFGFVLLYLLFDGAESLTLVVLCQLVAGIVVYFAVQMLLQKSFKVFSRRVWQGVGLLAGLLLIIGAVVRFDLLGYERRVPDVDKVVSVELNASFIHDYVYTDDPVLIEKMAALHRAILDQGPDEENREVQAIIGGADGPTEIIVANPNSAPWVAETPSGPSVSYHTWENECLYFNLNYNLADGTTMRRNYHLTVLPGTPLHAAMNEVINHENALHQAYFRGYGDMLPEEISGGYYSIWDEQAGYSYQELLTAEQARALYEAFGDHIRRKALQQVDALVYPFEQYSFNLEFRGTPLYENGEIVDYGDSWSVYSIPKDCTEVADLILAYDLATDYDELASEEK